MLPVLDIAFFSFTLFFFPFLDNNFYGLSLQVFFQYTARHSPLKIDDLVTCIHSSQDQESESKDIEMVEWWQHTSYVEMMREFCKYWILYGQIEVLISEFWVAVMSSKGENIGKYCNYPQMCKVVATPHVPAWLPVSDIDIHANT